MRSWIQDRYASKRGLARLALAHLESTVGRLTEFQSVEFNTVQRFVFVCLGNICRSPFAECVARARGVNAVGFGLSTTTGAPAFELAQSAAEKFSLDLSAHKATDFTDFILQDTDLLLVMEVRHARRLKQMIGESRAQIALLGHWGKPRRLHIHDPLEHSPIYFENCFQSIFGATDRLAAEYIAFKNFLDS